MTDLHTHILPGIDDGARTVEESISLLRMQLKSGVNTVALTPHFKFSAAEQPEFLLRRERSYNALSKAIDKHGLPIELILGAEVAFTTPLLELDLDSLCYEGTKTILIELPMDHYPAYAGDMFYRLMLDGYTPLIAHAERYSYFTRKPGLLEKLTRGGALVQVNAGGLLKRRTRKRILKMISGGLVHVLASDTHSMDLRPPRLEKAVKVIEKKLGNETAQRLVNFEL